MSFQIISCGAVQLTKDLHLSWIILKNGQHSWNPTLIKRRGRTFQKLSHLGVGVRIFLLERGDKPEKGRGWCRNGGVDTFLLLYSSITFTVCRGKVRFPLLLFISSVFWVNHARFSSKSLLRFPSTFSSKSCSKTWYHL